MDNKKTDQYYIDKIITDLTFIRTHTESLSKSKLEEDEILVDSIMFRLIQVAENSEKLTEKFKKTYPSIPWRAIKGLRNRIVHEYGNVDLTIVYDTVKKRILYEDFGELLFTHFGLSGPVILSASAHMRDMEPNR